MKTANAQAPSSLDNLKPQIEELLELREDVKQMQAEIKELEKVVKPATVGKGKIQVGKFVFECREQAGRRTVDKDALNEFLKQHGKSYDDFTKVGSPTYVMTQSEAATTL